MPIFRKVVPLGFLALLVLLFGGNKPAEATINRQINFQGKIVANANGTNISNGTYNMEFKIYSGGDGVVGGGDETLLWTEDRLVGGSGGVAISDGIFQVNLGAVTSLPGSVDFNNSTLWLSLHIGNTSSCTITTNFQSNCSGDGEMSPMVRFTGAPYAFNSDTLDGIDSTAFGQLGATSQTWTGTQTLQPTTDITSLIVKQTSAGSPTADIFKVQTANNTNIIQVTGPAANEAAVTIQSVGATRQLTLQSGSGTVSLGTSTGLTASGALTVSSGGSSGLTLDSASGRVTVATGDFLSLSVSGVSGAAAGDIWYDSAANKFKINENGTTKIVCNTTDAGCGAGGSSRLDQITAATGNASINNAANNVVWNWQLSAAETGMLFTENTASTGGGTQDQFILGVSTLSGSTASPFRVVSNSVDAADIVFNLASAGDFEIQDNGTAVLTVSDSGSSTFGGDVDLNGSFAAGNNAAVSPVAVVNFDHIYNSTCGFGCYGQIFRAKGALPNPGDTVTPQTVTSLAGIFLEMASSANSNLTVSNLHGLFVNTPAQGAGSTITNSYGINVQNQTAGTNSYGVYIAGANTYALWVDSGATQLDGTLTVGDAITASGKGVEFTPTDSNPACNSGNYNIYADLSEFKLKKCVNGVSSDIDGGTKYETFTANGTYTKPTEAVLVIVEAFGPGAGGGGGGSVATGTASTGGGAGGGGAYLVRTIDAGSVGGTVSVTVPAGGTGGAGGTNAAGSNGNAATGDTSFGSLLTAYRGGGGGKGNNSATLGGGGGGGGGGSAGTSSTNANGGAGGGPAPAAGSTDGYAGAGGGTTGTGGVGMMGGGGGAPSRAGGTTGFAGGSSGRGGAGGGAGGSCATTCASTNGGAGGTVPSGGSGGGGAGGTGAGGNGTAGAAGTGGFGGEGGGGGASNATANANGGAGGAGGAPGGGGGGGGAAVFATTGTGGAGGNGGRGEVRVWTVRGSGADLAEIYCTNDADIGPGSTVAIDTTLRAGVKKTDKAYDANALGVVATNPGLVMGGVEEQCAKPVLVALAGRVPIKVSTENGPIKAGDLLTPSSTPGVAMRATKAGQIVGQALADFNGQGVGTTAVFVKTDFAHGSTAGLVAEGDDANFGKQLLAYFSNEQPSMDQTKQDLSEVFTDRVGAALEITAPKVTTEKLATNTIEAATSKDVSINLAKDGAFLVKSPDGKTVLSFDGDHASVALDMDIHGGLTVDGPATFKGTTIFQKLVTFVEKTVFRNDVTFEGHVLTQGDPPKVVAETALGTAAEAKIEGTDASGQLSFEATQNAAAGKALTLTFKKAYAKPPRIFLTAANDQAANLKYYVESTPTGFAITLSDPPPPDGHFVYNYWVVQ